MTDHVELDDVLYLIEQALPEPVMDVVRDWGLLESALHRPRSTVFGTDAYPHLDQKAAALMLALARNHPLVDGNERLAWLAARFFYVKNGFDLRASDPVETDSFVRAVAVGKYDVDELARELGARIVPRP